MPAETGDVLLTDATFNVSVHQGSLICIGTNAVLMLSHFLYSCPLQCRAMKHLILNANCDTNIFNMTLETCDVTTATVALFKV